MQSLSFFKLCMENNKNYCNSPLNFNGFSDCAKVCGQVWPGESVSLLLYHSLHTSGITVQSNTTRTREFGVRFTLQWLLDFTENTQQIIPIAHAYASGFRRELTIVLNRVHGITENNAVFFVHFNLQAFIITHISNTYTLSNKQVTQTTQCMF
jgi:lipid-A-disaccharide synthase-like uncharacterized protein